MLAFVVEHQEPQRVNIVYLSDAACALGWTAEMFEIAEATDNLFRTMNFRDVINLSRA